jgi:predicted enzyme related to lactoylglutathione lyase
LGSKESIMTVTGPDFISLQVRDLEASAAFYEERLGLTRAPAPNPQAVVFTTSPIAFAVRKPLPGVDLDGRPVLGAGVGVWLHTDDARGLHERLVAADVEIVQPPMDGPFGVTFTFRDPDGYAITVHDKA